jgi:predicted ester cyclase
MSTQENKRIAREIVQEAFANGDFSVIDHYIAENFVDHSAPPGLPSGREGVKQNFGMMRTAFSDIQVELEHEIAEGDKVVHRATTTATHTGEFMGVSPTNKQVTWTEMHLIRFANGQAVEHWANFDMLGLMQQLGAVPVPE